jgi:hypothetical protein
VSNFVNVVNRGFEYICQWMSGTAVTTSSGWTYPTYIGWGGANGYNTVATPVLPGAQPTTTLGTGQWNDVAPYQEFSETRVAGVGTVPGGTDTNGSGTIVTQIVGTITASTGENVGESFLAFASAKPSSYSLNSNVTAGATTFTVATGTLVNGYYQVNNEVVHITAVSSNTIASTVVRAQNGSVAGTAKTGDVITFGNIPGSGPANPSNGDMFAHAGFTQLTLNSGDSIQFTWQVNVTS